MSELEARVLDPKLTPFERLCRIMEILRSPEGCAWDRAQTHASLLPYLVEEAYEVVEAVESGDSEALREELGDLLIQIVFHAQLARERGAFTVDDSINQVVDKLLRRHPHVFGERRELKPGQVRDQWEKIKTESGEKESVLSGLPRTMPALTAAFRIGEKAGGVGFDWGSAKEALTKVDEEIAEVRAAMDSENSDRRERLNAEFGDLLFAVASSARLAGVDPEASLRGALAKFRGRFELLEAEVTANRGRFEDYSLDELEAIWQQVKRRP
jgi:tetrapyrrole methylase family protein/MazG family protein